MQRKITVLSRKSIPVQGKHRGRAKEDRDHAKEPRGQVKKGLGVIEQCQKVMEKQATGVAGAYSNRQELVLHTKVLLYKGFSLVCRQGRGN
jgi:hypothetical protein